MRSSALASKTQHTTTKMDKRRIKIITKEMDEFKAKFPETKEFIDARLQQECTKENISVEEVIFLFTCQEAKSWDRKIFSFL